MVKNFDVIIIGSGIGSLTTASILSKIFNKKVLVLEKHFKVGGFTHTFKRKNYHWDVGVHYVGQMNKESQLRKVFDFISDEKVEWNKMPDIFEKFVYPDFTFNVYSNEKKYKNDLVNQFPDEKENIIKYFNDINKASKLSTLYFMISTFNTKIKKILLPLLPTFSKFYKITTKEYMDNNFKDEKLKALLTSQWGDYGLLPSKSSFLIHAIIVSHYFEGGYYPQGGSQKISDSIIPVIEKSGGNVLINHGVKEIIVKDNTAIGVRVQHKQGNNIEELEFYAPKIVSGAGAYTTYTKLLNEKYSKKFKQDLENLNSQGTPHINIFLGLKESPDKLGFKGENHWVYDSYNHDESMDKINFLDKDKFNFPFYYLSFPSLKDNYAKSHTAEIIIPISDKNIFGEWLNTQWKKRGMDYETLKSEIAENLINKIDSKYNGFKNLIDYIEVSTPLTTEYFTSHKNGNIYGIPAVPEKYTKYWLGVTTEIKNLYLAGSDAGSHGIGGAMMSSVFTAASIIGMPIGLIKIFKTIFSDKPINKNNEILEKSKELINS